MLATYPADGQGTATIGDAGVACAAPTPDCAVPTDVAIELRFDRFLLPNSALVAGLRLFTGDANGVSLSARYDVIERVVVLQTGGRLHPNALYTAEIVLATDPSQGFWAFDGAPLEPGPVPLRFSFATGGGPVGASPDPSTGASDDCVTLTAPSQASAAPGPLNGCASCHKAPPTAVGVAAEADYPPMGLVLTDWGLEHTAINRVAHETAIGNALDPGQQLGPRFGAQMNIVDPGAPERSYLMYKLLRKADNYALGPDEPCPVSFHSPVSDGACVRPGDPELARLGDRVVLGDPMPEAPLSISRDDLVRVANWIAAGALCHIP